MAPLEAQLVERAQRKEGGGSPAQMASGGERRRRRHGEQEGHMGRSGGVGSGRGDRGRQVKGGIGDIMDAEHTASSNATPVSPQVERWESHSSQRRRGCPTTLHAAQPRAACGHSKAEGCDGPAPCRGKAHGAALASCRTPSGRGAWLWLSGRCVGPSGYTSPARTYSYIQKA